MSRGELDEAVRGELSGYWRGVVAKPHLWLQDVFVDIGLFTLARAEATLTDGRLITKTEALPRLAGLGVLPELVREIERRRQGQEVPLSLRARQRRAKRRPPGDGRRDHPAGGAQLRHSRSPVCPPTSSEIGCGHERKHDGRPADSCRPPFEDIATARGGGRSRGTRRPRGVGGGPCALRVGEDIYLAYRLRRPVGQGRGYANVVARSADGVRFTTVATIGKDALGAESLERPALVVTDDGRWRLYVSVATPGTKHWRVVLLEASTPEGLATAEPRHRDAGQRPAGREGPGHRPARRPLARVGVLPPARRPRGDRPDDHRVRDE